MRRISSDTNSRLREGLRRSAPIDVNIEDGAIDVAVLDLGDRGRRTYDLISAYAAEARAAGCTTA
jgi:hypothetical protein